MHPHHCKSVTIIDSVYTFQCLTGKAGNNNCMTVILKYTSDNNSIRVSQSLICWNEGANCPLPTNVVLCHCKPYNTLVFIWLDDAKWLWDSQSEENF